MGSAAGSADEGEHVEGEAGRGCRAACVAGAWRPRDECVLTRSGAARENRRGAALRQARRASWAGPGRRRDAGWIIGPASTGGPEVRRRPVKGEKPFFKFYFQGIFKYQFSNTLLSKKMTSFENVPKIKVA